jgi:hypothetical protein
MKLSEFVKSDNGPKSPAVRPPLTDERYPGLVFPSPSALPGKDADDRVLVACSEIRTLAEPLVANLKTPLLALVGLCEKAHWLRMAAADAYVSKFDDSRAALTAGVTEAKSNVSVFANAGDPYGPRLAQAQGDYLSRMRKLLAQEVNDDMTPQADALAGQLTAAVEALDTALDGAEIVRALPSLSRSPSADDEARIAAVRRDLERLPFSDMEELYAKAVKLGDPQRLDDLEAAILPILDAFVTATPTERSWKLRGGHTEADLREGTIEKMLGTARSLRAAMLQSRESREPQDYDLAVGLAMKLRGVWNIVLGLPLGELPPADFARLMSDGGSNKKNPFPATSWQIAPGWIVRGLPAAPPHGWSRLEGWAKLGASRRREAWTAGAASSDRFTGLLRSS